VRFDGAQARRALVVALGQAAGEQVAAGRVTTNEATTALKNSIVRLFRVADPKASGTTWIPDGAGGGT
jgi:hypothetical protein